MSINKIPLWDNLKDYPEELDTLVSSLLSLSDRDYQMRVWVRAEGPEMNFYVEAALNFDYQIEVLKMRLRKRELKLSREQIKAILRTHVRCLQFERTEDVGERPEATAGPEFELFLINQPYWQKVRQQAAYALSLIKLPAPRVPDDKT